MSNPCLSKLFYTSAHFVDHYGLFKALHSKLKILIGFDLGFLQLLQILHLPQIGLKSTVLGTTT